MQSEMHSETGSIATACSPAVRAIKDNERQSKGISRVYRGRSREMAPAVRRRGPIAAPRRFRQILPRVALSAPRPVPSWGGIRRSGEAPSRLHQWSSVSSVVIRRHLWSSGAICGHQAPSVVIRRPHLWSSQASSVVIRRHQWSSRRR
jgi:hypothetical protein